MKQHADNVVNISVHLWVDINNKEKGEEVLAYISFLGKRMTFYVSRNKKQSTLEDSLLRVLP